MSKLTTFVTRGNITESIHDAKSVVQNFNYEIILTTGHELDLVYPRSAIKIFQAIPFIQSEAHKRYKLSKKEIAISCSSHSGEKQHMIVLHNWIKKIKINSTSLKCGTHNPLNLSASNKLLLSGKKPNQLHNNCAGKHLGMISGCLSNKMNVNNYVFFNHPYQKLIRNSLESITECKITKKQVGIDGCSAPQYAFPLQNLSTSMVNLIKNYFGKEEFSTPIKLLLDSILKYPQLTGGSKKFDSELMRITKGKIFSKGGAEGVLLFAHKEKKIGGVIKIKDGNERALPSAATAIFKKLSLITKHELNELSNWSNQQIYNHAKITVGKIYTLLK
jgi:L-asparaginase II